MFIDFSYLCFCNSCNRRNPRNICKIVQFIHRESSDVYTAVVIVPYSYMERDKESRLKCRRISIVLTTSSTKSSEIR